MIEPNHVVPEFHRLRVRIIQLGPRRERVAASLGIEDPIQAVEEVRLVLLDGTAEGTAPVLLRRFGLGEVVLRDKKVLRRHLVVRVRVEEAAVKRVRALLGDHVDDRAGRAAELGVVLIGQHLEFLHGVERRTNLAAARGAEIVVVVPAAVDREVSASVAAAADDQRLAGE